MMSFDPSTPEDAAATCCPALQGDKSNQTMNGPAVRGVSIETASDKYFCHEI